MTKNYGVEFPERPLMAVLSDLIGIPHFTTSNGGTVRSDFLKATLVALGGNPEGQNKEDLIRSCVEAAGVTFLPSMLNVGGTVTNETLQVIIDGVIAQQLSGERTRRQPPVPDVHFPEVDLQFDPSVIRDERERGLAERALRHGQDAFRTAVLAAYKACALTGANAPNALEAAHITPYLGPKSNVVSNGICLRADVHRLWDSGLLAVDETSMVVLIADSLVATSYSSLGGLPVRVPRASAERPSPLALRAHREWCAL